VESPEDPNEAELHATARIPVRKAAGCSRIETGGWSLGHRMASYASQPNHYETSLAMYGAETAFRGQVPLACRPCDHIVHFVVAV
jgi:hypothetical protein